MVRAFLMRFRSAPLAVAFLALFFGSLLLTSCGGASHPVSAAQSDAVHSTPGEIAKLAADGNRVAALTTHIAGSNDTIVVWQPPGSHVTQFVTGQNSAHPDGVI